MLDFPSRADQRRPRTHTVVGLNDDDVDVRSVVNGHGWEGCEKYIFGTLPWDWDVCS